MTEIARKVCLLGDFAVGKSSLVSRFVRNTFSDKYLTTVGVKIDSKSIPLTPELTMKLVVWDLAGKADSTTSIAVTSWCAWPAAGRDGTRRPACGRRLPVDAEPEAVAGRAGGDAGQQARPDDRWEVRRRRRPRQESLPTFRTSARDGDSVGDLRELARAIVSAAHEALARQRNHGIDALPDRHAHPLVLSLDRAQVRDSWR
jgi:hypothetical protein